MTESELLQVIEQAATEGWTKLDLSGKNLTALPPEIGKLTQLKKLILGKYEYDEDGSFVDIIGNKLTALPKEIGLLNQLEELLIIDNQLSSLPSKIGQLENLQSLHLSRNQLSSLPAEFGLSYQIPHLPGNYIAPQLLNIDQPEYNWEKSHNLILRYEYDFMPKGILTRFIVETHPWIEQQKLVWRSGVVLNKDETRAEIIENYNQQEIKVRLWGNRKRELLAVVTYELEKIHRSFERLQYQTMVPCNCEECAVSENPYAYPLENLRKRLNKGIYKIECENSYEKVDVRRLIDDVNLSPQPDYRQSQFQYTPLQRELESEREINLTVNIHNDNQAKLTSEIKNMNSDQSRKVVIGRDATNIGPGAFNLGEISGTVANTINQLPASPELDKPGIKELLEQLKAAIESEPNLSDDDKATALEQVQALAEAGQNPKEGAMQKVAKTAILVFKGIVAGLPTAAKLAETGKTLVPMIAKIFGL
ncbi:MAG: COR domain-containing protein [Calothrix sp. MO_167.B42]|nr:COR domain-containing protein [Calothrix sp. MO_167.B42]